MTPCDTSHEVSCKHFSSDGTAREAPHRADASTAAPRTLGFSSANNFSTS